VDVGEKVVEIASKTVNTDLPGRYELMKKVEELIAFRLRLIPIKEKERWMIAWEEGDIRVYGTTPEDAILNFEKVMFAGAIRIYLRSKENV